MATRNAPQRKSKPLTAAFQGERGAFSEQAARALCGEEVVVLPCPTFEKVFQSLASGAADRAVVPIENTLHGSIHENYDHLLRFQLPIVGETHLRIVHNLIGRPGTTFRQVRRVISHPVALNQCLKFFADNPQLQKEIFYDTAGSVKHLMESAPENTAAIASDLAAAYYGAQIIKRSIEDDRQNFTRFFLLAKPGVAEVPHAAPAKGKKASTGKPAATVKAWKTTIVFTVRNEPAALFRAMAVFALRNISLAKIESRPLRGRPWEYLFYVDFLGHAEEPNCQRALSHLQEFTESYRLLGSYPKAE